MARITVVNTYPDFVELMTSILDELAGHEVTGFDSSEVTLDDLLEEGPDLLIVDLDTATRVAGIGRPPGELAVVALKCVPMIVCSGDIPALRERADQFAHLSNVYALEKPFAIDALTDLVERALYRAALSPVA
jgi:DNA-binding NtrC family response regulator